MALPKGYEMLQMASFAMGAINKRASFQADVRDHYTRIDTANRQAALNNQLAYNSYLHINEEQMLTTVKRSFDVAAIYKKIRASKASAMAQMESQGGDSTIGSGLARIQNIERQGLEALARKDLNFQTELNDFKTRRKNVSLETLSRNNKAFSGLTSIPDATGLVAQTIGLGIEKYTDLGYYTDADGKVKARGFS
tara:strand:+ start:4530 stop:5114 length:585 start_codon:yes stop_codon:yes gene_type:complete